MVSHTAKVGLVLALASAGQTLGLTQDCGPTSYESCIEPMALGSTTFEFKPLFPDGVNFVFAFDVQSDEELAEEAIRPGETQVADAKVAFWLEYSEVTLDPSARQESYMAVLLGENITGTPSEGHNGCDGVLGAKCASNLVDFVKTRMSTGHTGIAGDLSYALANLNDPFDDTQEQVKALGCPDGILVKPYFVDGPPGTLGGTAVLAYENGKITKIMPSGNATKPFVTETIDDTPYDEMIDRVAIALLARVPLAGDLWKDKDNLQLEMVCTKAKSVSQADSGASDPSNDDSDRPSVTIDMEDAQDAGTLSKGFGMTLTLVAGLIGVVRIVM